MKSNTAGISFVIHSVRLVTSLTNLTLTPILLQFFLLFSGLADPQALPLAVATFQACHFIGKAECPVRFLS